MNMLRFQFCSSFIWTKAQFIKNSTEFLNNLHDNLENQFQDSIDLSLNDGVLNIQCAEGKTFVINRQTPNQQLWYSSPISGPQRYNYTTGFWMNSKNQKLEELLEQEIRKLLN